MTLGDALLAMKDIVAAKIDLWWMAYRIKTLPLWINGQPVQSIRFSEDGQRVHLEVTYADSP